MFLLFDPMGLAYFDLVRGRDERYEYRWSGHHLKSHDT